MVQTRFDAFNGSIGNMLLVDYFTTMRQEMKVYCILLYIMFLMGWYFVSFGVLIPYYSQATGLD